MGESLDFDCSPDDETGGEKCLDQRRPNHSERCDWSRPLSFPNPSSGQSTVKTLSRPMTTHLCLRPMAASGCCRLPATATNGCDPPAPLALGILEDADGGAEQSQETSREHVRSPRQRGRGSMPRIGRCAITLPSLLLAFRMQSNQQTDAGWLGCTRRAPITA